MHLATTWRYKWGFHLRSICSLVRIYSSVCNVLQRVAIEGYTYSQRGDVTFVIKFLLSFDFRFIFYVMKEIMGVTDILCHALQHKSEDI